VPVGLLYTGAQALDRYRLMARHRRRGAAFIVEGALAQPAAVRHMARTDPRPTAAAGDRTTRATPAPRVRATSRIGKDQPSSPSACRAAASPSFRHAA
jgi:hypothetical protein